MYNIEKFQCELYDEYCSKKTDVETSKMIVFYFLTILYIYIYVLTSTMIVRSYKSLVFTFLLFYILDTTRIYHGSLVV